MPYISDSGEEFGNLEIPMGPDKIKDPTKPVLSSKGTRKWVAVYGVAQSRTLLKRLSSSSSNNNMVNFQKRVALLHLNSIGKNVAKFPPMPTNAK